MNEEQIKDKIILHCKGLLSTNDMVYETSFNFLVGTFYEPEDCNILDDLDWVDQYQTIQNIFLKFIGGLLVEEDFDRVAVIRDIYSKLQVMFGEYVQDQDDLDDYINANNEYSKVLYLLLH